MAEQTLKEKTAKGLFWGGLSNGVQQGLGALFGIYLARTLDAGDYGLVGMLAIFSGIAGTIINSGFTVALTNKIDATHKDYNAVFWFTFFVGLICYLVLFLGSPLIAKFYNHPELVPLSRVVFLSFFLSGLASASYAILYKRMYVKQQAIIDMFAILTSGIIGIILAICGYAYWALALQNFIFLVGGALLRFIVAPWKPTLEIDFSPLKGMFSFSIKLFFTNIVQQINANIFSVVLGRFYDAKQVGFYTQSNKWLVMAMQPISGMLNMVAQPVFVEISSNKERQLAVFRKMLRFGSFVSFPMMLGLAFVAQEFILIAIGDKWLPSVAILQILCVWGAFSFIYTLYTQLLIARGRSDIILIGNILQGMLQIVSVIFVFQWGVLAMALVYVSVYMMSLIYWAYYVKREIGLTIGMALKDILPYLLITGIIFVLVGFLTGKIENLYLLFILKVLLSFIFYVSLMISSKSVIFYEFVGYIRKMKC